MDKTEQEREDFYMGVVKYVAELREDLKTAITRTQMEEMVKAFKFHCPSITVDELARDVEEVVEGMGIVRNYEGIIKRLNDER